MSTTKTTQTSYEITNKIFNSSREMKAYPGLSAGMVCETLGYYEKGDGGGAKYTIEAIGDAVANEMDIIAIGTDNTLIAKYLYEGKPVNVLQFGAINTYTTERPGCNPYQTKCGCNCDGNCDGECECDCKCECSCDGDCDCECDCDGDGDGDGDSDSDCDGDYDCNCVNKDTRDDQPAIQRAIDYTHDKLSEFDSVKIYMNSVKTKEDCYKNAINTVIIPEGNYIIKTQIKLPPYMRFYLEGDAQFISDVKPFSTNDIHTFKLKETGASTYKFESIDSFADVPEKTEIFAENDFCYGDTKLKLSESTKVEYNVYKHGTIKICYRFDENGDPINPYKAKVGNRYAVGPYVNNDIFCGPGSLTLNNKTVITKDNGATYTNPYYNCAIEIGSTEENIRYYGADGEKIKKVLLNYENLRFKKLKIRGFHIGMLQHGYSFYSNVISDIEFWDNDIAFQFGIYAEEDDLNGVNDEEGGYIIREEGYACGEMNHFRDCLFTGNKISVNMKLSGCNTYFTECHFDYENCIFRAAYRANIIVDKCHIEGTGSELSKAYFQKKDEATKKYSRLPITQEMLDNFKNRASDDPINEFVGIIYAKPLTRFSGSQVDQYSYVDLSITSSRIVDNEFIPWGLFSYYNKGTADTCDGHFRSNLYLNNNVYGIGNILPVSFLTTKDNGIVQSGFLLSEFLERELPSGTVGTEQDAIQNVPVTSCNSNDFGSFFLTKSLEETIDSCQTELLQINIHIYRTSLILMRKDSAE